MRRLVCSMVFSCLILFASSEARSQFSFKRIAITDESTQVHVPTVGESQMTFESFSNAMITADGEAAFAGSVVGPMGVETGLWTQAFPSPILHVMAKENLPLWSSTGGIVFGSASAGPSFGPLKLESGHIPTFRARLHGADVTATTDSALFLWTGSVPITQFREGDLARLAESTTVGDLFELPTTVQETVLRRVPVLGSGPSRDTGVYGGPPSLFIEGDRIDGITSLLGDVLSVRPIRAPSLEAVMRAPRGETGEDMILRLTGGQLRPLVLEGEQLSNDASLQVSGMNHPVAVYDRDDFGFPYRAVYGATLSGPGVLPSNDTGILSSRNLDGLLLIREGSQVSDRPAGVVFGDLGTDNIVGSSNGRFVFNSTLSGPAISDVNDWALIAASIGPSAVTTRVLAQEGNSVSGLPIGSVLTGLDAPHFQLSLRGDMIFNAEFTGPNGDGTGLFYTTLDQTDPSLIVRTGQEFDIGGGMFKTISDIGLMEMSNPWDGRAAQINDRGEVVFGLTFSDGSQGIFTTVVPEPATIVLAGLGGLFLLVLMRRHALVSRFAKRQTRNRLSTL